MMAEPAKGKKTVTCLVPEILQGEAKRALGAPAVLMYAPMCDAVTYKEGRVHSVCFDLRYGSVAYAPVEGARLRYVTGSRVRGLAGAPEAGRRLVDLVASLGYVRSEDVGRELGVDQRAAAALVDDLKRSHVIYGDEFGLLRVDSSVSMLLIWKVCDTPYSLGRLEEKERPNALPASVEEGYVRDVVRKIWGAEVVATEFYGYPLWVTDDGRAVDAMTGHALRAPVLGHGPRVPPAKRGAR